MHTLGPIEALGTHWWVEVYDEGCDTAAVEPWLNRRLLSFNDTYSRFRGDSLVGQLNTTGQVSNPPAEFIALLTQAKHWYQETNGVINVLTANQQIEHGYGSQDMLGTHPERSANPGTDLIINDTQVTLTRGALDLGSFAKGWLIDQIVQELDDQFTIQHVLINGGGDMYATSLQNGQPIEIAVEHPTQPASYIAKIPLYQQGFAASSTYKRRWLNAETEYNHVLASGAALTQNGANHVVAATAEQADVYATFGCITPTVLPAITGIDYCYLPEQAPARISATFRTWLLK